MQVVEAVPSPGSRVLLRPARRHSGVRRPCCSCSSLDARPTDVDRRGSKVPSGRELRPYLSARTGDRVGDMNSIPPEASWLPPTDRPMPTVRSEWAAEQAFLEGRRLVVFTAALRVNSLAAAGVGSATSITPRTSSRPPSAPAHSAAARAVRIVPVSTSGVLAAPRRSELGHRRHIVGRPHGRPRVPGSGQGERARRSDRSAHRSRACHLPRRGVSARSDLKVKHGVSSAPTQPGSLPVIDFAFRQAALRGQPLTSPSLSLGRSPAVVVRGRVQNRTSKPGVWRSGSRSPASARSTRRSRRRPRSHPGSPLTASRGRGPAQPRRHRSSPGQVPRRRVASRHRHLRPRAVPHHRRRRARGGIRWLSLASWTQDAAPSCCGAASSVGWLCRLRRVRTSYP